MVTDGDRRALTQLGSAVSPLGGITNTMTEGQESRIRTGHPALVQGWLRTPRAGAPKPASEVFVALARRLECALEGWMIGESLTWTPPAGTPAG